MSKNAIGEWIEKQWTLWDASKGQRSSMEEFAAHMGNTKSFISQVISGKKKPSAETVRRWARITDDYEIYDIMEIERPDMFLEEMGARFDALPDERKREIEQLINDYLEAHGYERIK